MYCIKYSNRNADGNFGTPYTGFFKPYNAVRDLNGTYSLTYLPPSVINGIENWLEIPQGSILRHKLTFDKNGMTRELVKTTYGVYWKNGKEFKCFVVDKSGNKQYDGMCIKHCLVNPEIIFAFDTKEHAEIAAKTTIFLGQMEYIIYPQDDIKEMSEEEFDKLPGVETFQCEENNGVFCGFNRFKNNEKQFVEIVRKEWM